MRRIGWRPAAAAMAILILGAACGGEDISQRQSTQLLRSTPTAATAPTQATEPAPTDTPAPVVDTPTPEPADTPTATAVQEPEPADTPTTTAEPEAVATETPAPKSPMDAPAGEVLKAEIVGFKLPDLRIEVGTTVSWVNLDQVGHTSTSGTP